MMFSPVILSILSRTVSLLDLDVRNPISVLATPLHSLLYLAYFCFGGVLLVPYVDLYFRHLMATFYSPLFALIRL